MKYLAKDDHLINSDSLIDHVNNNTEIAIDSLKTLCIRNVSCIEKLNDNLFSSSQIDLKYAAINNSIENNFLSKENALEILKEDMKLSNNIPYIINNISRVSYDFTKDEIVRYFYNLEFVLSFLV